jgi:hypothetical protein
MQTTTHKDLQDSGAYNTPFYITKHLSFDKIGIENIEWNRELHREYSIDEDDLTDLSEDDIDYKVRDDFYESATIYNYYRQVEEYNYYRQVEEYNYDEEDAYKCDLIPFTIYDYNEDKNIYLLGLGGCGMDLSPKLDAYYFLQTGKMDPASMYFRHKDYFKSLVSDEIFNAIEDKFGGVTV